MKRNYVSIIMFSLLLTVLTQTFAAVETYTIDPQHSYVQWHISHFGFSNPSGKWMVNGTLILDEAMPQNSKVNVSIHVADMITGNPELDKHLRSKLFFDVEQFPTATFTSVKISVTGKKTAKINGILTLRGISKPIALNATFNRIGENPVSNKMTVGFSATTELVRSNFDINALLPGLGDIVTISIELEAFKQQT